MTATCDGPAVPETLGDGAELLLGEGRTPVLRLTVPDLPAETVRGLLARHGALLVRGLGLAAPADLGRAARALGVTPMTEREGFTGRTDFGDGVYGASEWRPMSRCACTTSGVTATRCPASRCSAV